MSEQQKDELPARTHQPHADWHGLTDAQVVTIVEGDVGPKPWRLVMALRELSPLHMRSLVFVVALACATVIGARDGPIHGYFPILAIVAIAARDHGDSEDT